MEESVTLAVTQLQDGSFHWMIGTEKVESVTDLETEGKENDKISAYRKGAEALNALIDTWAGK